MDKKTEAKVVRYVPKVIETISGGKAEFESGCVASGSMGSAVQSQ